MNLKSLAEHDLSLTMETDGQEFTFTDNDNVDHTVKGRVNDIGFATDAMGAEIASRSMTATWRMSSLVKDGEYILPDNGWKVTFKDLLGNDATGYVTRVEPDRSIGVGRVYLSVDLS